MKTYEDLVALGENDAERGAFAEAAVNTLRSTSEYRMAITADRYYRKHNATIEDYVRWLYTVTGRQIQDTWSADHRLKTSFFRRFVIQKANYLLGKGVQFADDVKDRFGAKFDSKMIKLAKMAMVEGRSFGFWNVDHLEVFGFACTENHAGFCPLYSEEDGTMKAGIRFRYKQVAENKTLAYYTLYEPEGYTEFIKRGNDPVEVLEARKAYKITTVRTAAEGIISVSEEGYDGRLPIIPMYASDTYESDLEGLQEEIDCYDLIKSGLANNIDDASEIYWIVKNAGGMDDPDLAKFLQRVKTTRAVAVNSEDGGDVSAQSMTIPTDARKTMLEILRTDLYDDAMLLDMKSLSAAQKTTQELQAAYQPQDDGANDLEFYVCDFMDELMALVGVESEIVLQRNKAVNFTEQTNMVLSAANFLSPECVIRHLPFLSPEEQEEEILKIAEMDIEKFSNEESEEETEEEAEEEEETEEEETEE